LAKEPEQRYPDCRALHDALGALQMRSDESLAAELSKTIRALGSDWGKFVLMPDSVKRPPRPHSLPAQRMPLATYFESATPAFASGLVSEQPRSVSEHTRNDREARRERWPQPLRLAFAALTVGTTAIALALLVSAGTRTLQRPTGPAAAPELRLNDPASGLPTRLRACGDRFGHDHSAAKAELAFDELGRLTTVRLIPQELVGTQLGACLLESIWKMNMSAPGTKSLVLDLSY
jgi:hypothetical protein